MKLFYSPFHTFIHKVLVTAHEAGLWNEITFVPTYPFKNRDGEGFRTDIILTIDVSASQFQRHRIKR